MTVSTNVKITGDAKGALGAIDKVKGGLSGLSKTAASLPGFTALGASVASAFSAASIVKIIDTADAMAKLSRRTGVSVEELSKYQYAADLSGVETEQLANSLDKLNKAIKEASIGIKKPADAFTQLGVSVTNADGSLRNTAAVLNDVMAAYAAFPDGPEKATIAMDLFGESGSRLASFLGLGKEGMEALRIEAERLGIVIRDDTAKAAERLNDQLTRLGKVWDGAWTTAGNAVLPTFDPFMKEAELAQKLGLSWLEQLEVLGRRSGPGNPINAFLEDASDRTEELREQATSARKALDELLNRKSGGESGLADDIDSAQSKLEFFQEALKQAQKESAATTQTQSEDASQLESLKRRLAEEKTKYEKAVAEESRKTVTQQIKDAEKLRDSYVKAWEDASKAAAKYREEGKQQAGDLKSEAQSAAPRGDAPSTVQGFSVTSKRGAEVQAIAAAAIASAYDGRFERVAKLADEANQKIQAAADYAKTLEDPNERARIFKDIAVAAEQTGEAQAKVADRQKADFEGLASDQKAKIDELTNQLDALKSNSPEIDVKVNSEQALENIRNLEAAIKKLKDEAAQINVGSTQSKLSPAEFQGSGGSGSFAGGGFTGWGGKFAPAGIVHRGEYVFPQEAVRRLGLETLRDLHLKGLRGYASGGLVAGVSVPQIKSPAPLQPRSVNLSLTIDGQRMEGLVSESFSGQIEKYLRKAQLKKGAR